MITQRWWLFVSVVLLVILTICLSPTHAVDPNKRIKVLGFTDPNTNYLYRVISYIDLIKVSRVKLGPNKLPASEPESIQTLKFSPTLVDFDIQCLPTHCYLATVTSHTRANLKLFNWTRTQFDVAATRDTFAIPTGVKLFNINSGFYIAIAQEQLQLSPKRLAQEYNDEPTRFIGCAVLKFLKGFESDLKYHQFIRLPFNPQHVSHFKSFNSNNITGIIKPIQPTENHYIAFSENATWTKRNFQSGGGGGSQQVYSFIWSPLNDRFWPYRMPQNVEFVHRPGGQIIKFPDVSYPTSLNLTNLPQQQRPNQVESVETCFYQLQRLLADRDIQSRRLIDSSKSIWRSLNYQQSNYPNQYSPITNISARVIVHGDVIVKGSLIESPQISLIGGQSDTQDLAAKVKQVAHIVNSHSPTIVENKLKEAVIKLKYLREKLLRAVPANLLPSSLSSFNNQIRFFGPIEANEVIFNGLVNSNVRLNGIPFNQLEHELVSLDGSQNIGNKVMFDGRVVADVLEIHGEINDYYYLRDAIDITSRQVQIIDVSGGQTNYIIPNQVATIEFKSISAPEIVMAYNATFNTISLNDFIVRDNKTQLVHGRKSFKRLSMGALDLAHHSVKLNNHNISRLARNAIRLRSPDFNRQQYQTINGYHSTFLMKVRANKLTINNMINQHVNLSSLIYDSVKTNDANLQQIYGQKNFINGLKINSLLTEGSLNGIDVGQIFNLNEAPPLPDSAYTRFINATHNNILYDVPITGQFRFRSPATVFGSLSAGLINNIDIDRRAVRRVSRIASSGARLPINSTSLKPQIVHGHKRFYRPLRVLNSVKLLDINLVNQVLGNTTRMVYPLINGIDLRRINDGLERQMKQPSLVTIENLEIEGNLNIPSTLNQSGPPMVTLGNYSTCPLDLIRRRLVLAGGDDQYIESPIKVQSLRARSATIDPLALNGLQFPADFVLRTAPYLEGNNYETVQPVYGNKYFDHLVITPSMLSKQHQDNYDSNSAYGTNIEQSRIIVDHGSSVNNISYSELQTILFHERQRNSTGEKVFATMNVYGNIHSKRINGYYWPDDILLKSISSTRGTSSTPYLHKRIYSPLIFANSTFLQIDNQLVLRGPVQLHGRMNGVNLTEFARQSATYGDKDLFSNRRPVRNKLFIGGLTVKGEIRSQGYIDGVNFEEMKSRVVTIGPSGKRVYISGPKTFMSDTTFEGPLSMMYLNELPVDYYLSRIQFQPDGSTIRIRGKKSTSGALRINRNLFVHGTINGIDFAELKDRAISLSPDNNPLIFNKTLTVEGDVFMDNLWIDERNGTIDGVKLTNLLPIGVSKRNEIVLAEPRILKRTDPINRGMQVHGSLQECQVSCHLQPMYTSTHVKRSVAPESSPKILEQLELLRHHIISINLIRLSTNTDLVVGFIEASHNDIAGYHLPELDSYHSDHTIDQKSFLQLDQIDFPFRPTIYHLSVGVDSNRAGLNITKVYSSLGGSNLHELSVLPIEYPNSAMFLHVPDVQALFLLISQDYTIKSSMCPPSNAYYNNRAENGIHVYLFYALQNSSSLESAYFDLYQTIDLPGVDSFEKFQYAGSAYVLAISRSMSRIYLLLLRGYSGFELVSSLEAPMIEYVTIMYTHEQKPVLIVHQTSGLHRLMEAVII